MGGLFSTRLKALPHVQINLESAEPQSDSERSISTRFGNRILQNSEDLITRFSGYQDAQGAICVAISNPTNQTKTIAWEAVCPNVELQMDVFEFAKLLSQEFFELIKASLESLSPDSDAAIFERMPALTKCLAEAFDLILLLDELKLAAPKLINDLAYFRRNGNEFNSNGQFDRLLERSNETTIFWASPTPALSFIIQQLKKDYPPSAEEKHQKLLLLLGGASDVGASILKYQPPESEKVAKLCLRCITAATLMFDQVSVEGAFALPPKFHVKEGMQFLVSFVPKQTALINAIKYGSKHLGDEGSDPKVKELFQ